MKAGVTGISEILAGAKNRQMIAVHQGSHLTVAVQKIDGSHDFRHINKTADEHIIVLEGKISIWTQEGRLSAGKGDMISIPHMVEHGDIEGEKAEIIILESDAAEEVKTKA